MSDHALLSPSAAHRWLNCFPAAVLESAEPDTDSDFAREGTLAHAYGARWLKASIGEPSTKEDAEIKELQQYYADEMMDYVSTYTTVVLERLEEVQKRTPDARLIVEQRLNLEPYLPDGFGTADAIILADGTLDIFDLKYGKGVRVDAVGNDQMRIYALGALQLFDTQFAIDRVRMTIVQPRLENISTAEMSATDLLAWGDDYLRPRAILAAAGMGTPVPGSWCRFCKVKGKCRGLAELAEAASTEGADYRLLNNEELAKILPQLDTIANWVEAVREHAQGLALSGQRLPGYKLVEGRSKRIITDTAKAAALLTEAGYASADFLKPQELLGMTALEKLVGRKKLAEVLEGVIERPRGKPTLVPDTDKRDEYDRSAAADFAGIDTGTDKD